MAPAGINVIKVDSQDVPMALRQAHHYDTQYDGAARQLNWLMGVQSTAQWQLPKSTSDVPTIITALPDGGRLESLAGKYRLDLLLADYDRKIADTTVTLARLGFIPQTTLGADFARDDTAQKNWSGGPNFNTSIPIFDPGIVAYWSAKYQQEQTERTYITLGAQVKQDVRSALNALQIAAKDVAFYRDITIPQEEENVKLAQPSNTAPQPLELPEYNPLRILEDRSPSTEPRSTTRP